MSAKKKDKHNRTVEILRSVNNELDKLLQEQAAEIEKLTEELETYKYFIKRLKEYERTK
jgi:predicted RNase H-like nuclease (RuvC/YqgF family)